MTRRPAVFSQIYLAGALVAFAASFAPLWAETDPERAVPRDDYSLWTILPRDGGAALLGIVFVLALAGLAVAAATSSSTWGPGIPAALVVLSVLGVLLLLAKPETGDPAPALGAGAGLLFGTSIFLGLTAVVDLWMSLSDRGSAR